ncbi:hypothetical protein F5884DRAFT_293264 [Xylogone sp. PMI_703]|nr:hypothetical protein F5884DRAFT_293264 [Xylogone sp. PMI_703]
MLIESTNYSCFHLLYTLNTVSTYGGTPRKMGNNDPSPEAISRMREIFFDLPIPFSLSMADHKLFWPLMDDMYSCTDSHPVTKGPALNFHYICCRFKTRQKSPISCNAAFRIIEYADHMEYQPSSRRQPTTHTHSLEDFSTRRHHKRSKRGMRSEALINPRAKRVRSAQDWKAFVAETELKMNKVLSDTQTRFTQVLEYTNCVEYDRRVAILEKWEQRMSDFRIMALTFDPKQDDNRPNLLGQG